MNECVSVRESLVNTPVQHISLATRESPALSAGLRIGQGLGRGPGGPPAAVFTEAGGCGCRLLPGCEDALATPSHHKGQKSQLVKGCSFLFSNSFIGIWFASYGTPSSRPGPPGDGDRTAHALTHGEAAVWMTGTVPECPRHQHLQRLGFAPPAVPSQRARPVTFRMAAGSTSHRHQWPADEGCHLGRGLGGAVRARGPALRSQLLALPPGGPRLQPRPSCLKRGHDHVGQRGDRARLEEGAQRLLPGPCPPDARSPSPPKCVFWLRAKPGAPCPAQVSVSVAVHHHTWPPVRPATSRVPARCGGPVGGELPHKATVWQGRHGRSPRQAAGQGTARAPREAPRRGTERGHTGHSTTLAVALAWVPNVGLAPPGLSSPPRNPVPPGVLGACPGQSRETDRGSGWGTEAMGDPQSNLGV
ncbi:hypothetical protein J1605_002354 [Eschrichtius robustus]|uniref:Uncharacterized protein n=1 Tax=Eschrichtius robustus TaxID=9764 RepID=A0AB34HX02_ESCRO|nr:hypothetical protein J1605_002354 [Eschrichtius robustus]